MNMNKTNFIETVLYSIPHDLLLENKTYKLKGSIINTYIINAS